MSQSPVSDIFHAKEEAPFHAEELFFTRTDDRGVILGSNAVLRRVSGYEGAELVGTPQNMVRHKDMPRAVFWLMWEAIKTGSPFGAYVKNRAKNGQYYWVFVIVLPVGGECISVQLKPTSALLKTVEGLYATIRKQENGSDLSPKDSAKALLAALAEQGYPDYASFMSQALSREIVARDGIIQHTSDGRMGQFVDMLETLEKIRAEGRKISRGFAAIEGSPKNMRIQATRLGEFAAPLGVISTNFDSIASNIKSGIGPFISALDKVALCMSRGLFINCAYTMLNEILQQLEAEDEGAGRDETRHEIDLLKERIPHQREKAQEVLQEGRRDLAVFANACQHLKRTLSGLNMMRVMSEIEAARIGDAKGSMREIITQLHRFQTLSQECLNEIQTQSDRIDRTLRHELQTKRAA